MNRTARDDEEEDPVHESVMEATAAVLAEEGFAGFTMRKVAGRIDASKSTLHYRYDTKEGLLTAFLEHNSARQSEVFEEFATEPPLDRLVGILDHNLQAIAEPALEGLLPAYIEMHARAARTEAFREAIRASELQYRSELVEIVEAGVEDGVFRDVNPEATATLLIAVPDSAGLTQHTLGDEAVVDRLRTAVNELIFESLLVEDADVDRGELL